MDLHLYFFDERKNNIIHRVVKCKETPNKYTPDRAFPYIAMSYLPKDNIGRVVGTYGKAVMFTERNDKGAREAFKSYFTKEKEHTESVIEFKQGRVEEMEKQIESFKDMEIEERS